MRSDTILYTGMNSGTAQKLERVKLKERDRKEVKSQSRAKLLPVVDVFNKEIDNEIKKVIIQQLDLVDKDSDITSEAKALKLYKESMKGLKARISNIMREPTKRSKT